MSQTNGVDAFLNKTMKFILRSPLHRLVSHSLMLITFTGRKSGKFYTTPIGYSEHDGEVVAFTHAVWWKNLRGGAPVTLRLRGREFAGIAEPVENKEAVAAGLMVHLQMIPGNARFYGVTIDPVAGLIAEDVDRAAQNAVMIRVRLYQPSLVKAAEIIRGVITNT